MPTYYFSPPATDELPRNYKDRQDRFIPVPRPAPSLFRYIRRGKVGRTVLKDGDGNYQTKDYPSQDECDAAAIVYLGGHRYSVTEAEKTALEAAGYEVETIP